MRKLISDAYAKSKEILRQNRPSLNSVAELLLEKETVYKEDLEKILGARPQPVPAITAA